MGEIHKLRIKSPYELMKIVDIKIENKPNEHGYLYLKCLIDENINFNSTIKASTEDQIIVYEELEDAQDKALVNINEVDERNSKRLFNGLVQNMRTTNISGIYYLEIQALTSSIKLDIEKKSRSFQNVDMTYNDLINNMLSYYPGYGFAQYAGKGKIIEKPLFQYKETDWEFLKRIASELNLELYSDIINLNFMFNFGIPDEHIYELEDNISYDAFKDLKSFHKAGGYNAGYDDTDYFYYEVRIRDILEIGSEISYKQKSLYVREYEAYKDKEEIFYKYKLCREKGVWQSIIYNKLLKGATLEGEVLAVQNEQVKLHLSIDESQDEGAAYWFNYAPPSVNIMYSMPLVGEYSRLYFPNEETETPIVTGCIRKNGDTCEGTADTENRYLHTEYGSEIALLPGALNIKSGSEAPLSINLEDETGVTITSPNGLNLNAGGEIVINTPSSVNISAQSQILMLNRNSSNVSLEGEINLLGEATISNGSDRTAFSKFTDDEPQQVQLVEPKALVGKLITKNSAKLLKDINGNDISFLDACRAENALNSLDIYNAIHGNIPLCGAVITQGKEESSWILNYISTCKTPGNATGILGSTIQVGGEAGKAIIPKAISNAIKPTYSFEFKNIMEAKAVQNTERFADTIKVGDFVGKAAVVVDVAYSGIQDIKDPKVSAGKVATNAVVNLDFDCAGLGASTAVGSLGGPVGAFGGLIVGLVYIGATQVWKPIKKKSGDGNESIQDAAKDTVYDDMAKAVNSQPIYQEQTKIDDEGHYPKWIQYMK